MACQSTEQDDEERIKTGFPRKRATISHAKKGKPDGEDNETTNAYLQHRHLFGLTIRAEQQQKKIMKCGGNTWQPAPPIAQPISVRKLRSKAEDQKLNSQEFTFDARNQRMRVVLTAQSCDDGIRRYSAVLPFEFNNNVCAFDEANKRIAEAVASNSPTPASLAPWDLS